jgi:uncharacterized protein YecE (DUF72 family)
MLRHRLWGEIVLSKAEGLKSAAKIIQEDLPKRLDTYVNVNNHYEGCAPLSIERLLALV